MKKLLIIQDTLGGGGAERVLVEMLNNFDYTKYAIDLLLIYNKGIFLQKVPPNVNVLSIYPNGERPKYKSLLKKLNLISLIKRREIRNKITKDYDVIFSFLEGIAFKYHSYIFHKGQKNLTWVHTDLSMNHWSSIAFHNLQEEQQCYENIDNIVFVSENAQIGFKKIFEVTTKQTVLYNLIDTDRILSESSLFEVKKRKFTICNVGRLVEQKRHDRLLNVAKILKENGYDVEFWILGIGTLENSLKKMAVSFGVADIVHFYGFIENPYPYIKNADLFVLSSDTEGLPVVVCESLCLGTAVVSTKVTGTIELLLNSEYGVLTESSPIALFEAIKELIDTPSKLEHYQRKAIERAEMFDIPDTMSKIYNLLDN